MMLKFATQLIMAFIATVSFSVLFNVPKKELLFSGLTATVGWFFYQLVLLYYPLALVGASFAGAIAITVCGRYLCYLRKTPVTIYLISGIIPLVPGAGIYYTMYEMIINNENLASFNKGVETLKIAGVIAIGIITVLSLPSALFDLKRSKSQ